MSKVRSCILLWGCLHSEVSRSSSTRALAALPFPVHTCAASLLFGLMAGLDRPPRMQVVKVISGALKALGNHNAGTSKVLIELYVAMLASGEVTVVLSSGV